MAGGCACRCAPQVDSRVRVIWAPPSDTLDTADATADQPLDNTACNYRDARYRTLTSREQMAGTYKRHRRTLRDLAVFGASDSVLVCQVHALTLCRLSQQSNTESTCGPPPPPHHNSRVGVWQHGPAIAAKQLESLGCTFYAARIARARPCWARRPPRPAHPPATQAPRPPISHTHRLGGIGSIMSLINSRSVLFCSVSVDRPTSDRRGLGAASVAVGAGGVALP